MAKSRTVELLDLLRFMIESLPEAARILDGIQFQETSLHKELALCESMPAVLQALRANDGPQAARLLKAAAEEAREIFDANGTKDRTAPSI